ncbi:chromosome partitioning protein ParB [Cereibacter changlensis JA139]|uniref:Chromosome partitioning protein ParB n=2 Tax=Cereibacter changlensis TaxID=402884 RepID=A0A2T4JNT2_9RHOB|nr:ParB N-terminal domain-containing protein [Cereibacter changlensis]PTE19513.1 chromosome partitioning protein ParB [Cereibacter changlensis JA139]PZX47749.1 ParB family chromosome partitioning protein [Cereibacter changlensis]
MAEPIPLQIDKVAVAEVIVRDRLRPVSEAGVESLIASVTELGVLKDPIHLRKKKDGKLYLMAGAHRLEVARRLGWEEISAKVWTGATDDWALLMEIDDNLAGAEMNALDTAVFLATRKQVYERLHPETRRGMAGAAARWDATDTMAVAFVKATAEKFGLSDRHVYRMAAAGRSIAPEQIKALRAAPKPVSLKDLTELAKIGDTYERDTVIERLAAGEAKSAAEAWRSLKADLAGAPLHHDPVEDQYKALRAAWSRASAAARRRWLEEDGDDVARYMPRPGAGRK